MVRHCVSGKTSYDTQTQAEDQLIHILATTHSVENGPNGVYRCEYCSCYHLTSKSRDTTFINAPETKSRILRARELSKWKDFN